jgi:hypothetical protein
MAFHENYVSLPIPIVNSLISKHLIREIVMALGDDFAPMKIFYALPSPLFSAALNSAPKHPSLLLFLLFPCLPTTHIPK